MSKHVKRIDEKFIIKKFDTTQKIIEQKSIKTELIEVLSGKDWKISVDNSKFYNMKEGNVFRITAGSNYKLRSGKTQLSALIKETEESEPLEIGGLDAIELAKEIGEDMDEEFSGPLSPSIDL